MSRWGEIGLWKTGCEGMWRTDQGKREAGRLCEAKCRGVGDWVLELRNVMPFRGRGTFPLGGPAVGHNQRRPTREINSQDGSHRVVRALVYPVPSVRKGSGGADSGWIWYEGRPELGEYHRACQRHDPSSTLFLDVSRDIYGHLTSGSGLWLRSDPVGAP